MWVNLSSSSSSNGNGGGRICESINKQCRQRPDHTNPTSHRQRRRRRHPPGSSSPSAAESPANRNQAPEPQLAIGPVLSDFIGTFTSRARRRRRKRNALSPMKFPVFLLARFQVRTFPRRCSKSTRKARVLRCNRTRRSFYYFVLKKRTTMPLALRCVLCVPFMLSGSLKPPPGYFSP